MGQSRPRELATMQIEAGEHEVAVELVAPVDEGPNYWMGLTAVELQPADSAAELVAEEHIDRVERTDLGDGAVSVRVIGRDGAQDHVFSALDAAERNYGDGLTVGAQFAAMRIDADGLASAQIIGGTRLSSPQIDLTLSTDAWRAEVVEVDEEAREVVLEMDDPALPEGDVLRGAAIYFSNPDYSRNTAYHVEGVTRDGDRTRVRVRESTFLLGKAVVDGAPLDDVTLTSVVPHPYDRTMARSTPPADLDFFAGKLLTTADGSAATTIRNLATGQPITITVDSTEGFTDGAECYYHDVRPGDSALINTSASLQRSGPDTYTLQANTSVTVGDQQISAEDALAGAEVRLR
jgi:hypothetical protein